MKILIQEDEFENAVCNKEPGDIFRKCATTVRDSHMCDYLLWYLVEQQMLKKLGILRN